MLIKWTRYWHSFNDPASSYMPLSKIIWHPVIRSPSPSPKPTQSLGIEGEKHEARAILQGLPVIICFSQRIHPGYLWRPVKSKPKSAHLSLGSCLAPPFPPWLLAPNPVQDYMQTTFRTDQSSASAAKMGMACIEESDKKGTGKCALDKQINSISAWSCKMGKKVWGSSQWSPCLPTRLGLNTAPPVEMTSPKVFHRQRKKEIVRPQVVNKSLEQGLNLSGS